MIVNGKAIRDLTKSVRTMFNEALETTNPLYRLFTLEVPSESAQEDYGWLGDLPQVEEWLGDRTLSKLQAHTYAIKNRKWANGIEISVDDLEDDKLGMLRPRAESLAEAFDLHRDALFFDLLADGFTKTGYDGQFFFDTDHQDANETAQSNKGTAALSTAAFESAWKAMTTFKNTKGDPLMVRPTHLVVGPDLYETARDIIEKERLANGETNKNFRRVEVVLAPRLDGSAANYWFLFDLSKRIKPFIYQLRRPVRLRAMDAVDDEAMFMRDVVRWGADGRYNMGYGLWQLAWGSDGTT